MFDRFTAPARRAAQRAFRQARRGQHDFLGTEHLLFGLLCEPEGGVADLLRARGVAADLVMAAVETRLADEPAGADLERFPVSPAVQRVFAFAAEEASALGVTLVGPEHLLLGLLREPSGGAAILLAGFGLTLDAVRHDIAQLPPADKREHALAAGIAPVTTPSASPPSLDALVAAPLTFATLKEGEAERPSGAPAGVALTGPPPIQQLAALLDAQLRRTQLALGAVLGFGLGFAFAGWQVGLLATLGGLAVASVRNSGTAALVGFLAGFLVIPRVADGLHASNTSMNLLLGGVGALLGSFLGDFWRPAPPPEPTHDDPGEDA